MAQRLDANASSTGLLFTAGDWLDVHFEAERPVYEAQLRAVGIQPGWHVLDAGCGSGSFLPWLADLVGPTGSLFAIDLAPDNVALVEQRLAMWALPCLIEVQVGNVLTLPYPDDAFDALWFANTSQYLTDEELGTALAEFRRVVRPGGLVAVKEIDPAIDRILPAPTGVMLRWIQAAVRTGNVQAAGGLRGQDLPGWLRRAGLEHVRRRSMLSEHTAPLDPAGHAFWTGYLNYLAASTTDLDLPEADQEFWARLRDPAEVTRFLDNPDCCVMTAQILTVGTVPEDTPVAAVNTND